MKISKKNLGLDVLRAIAITLVVISHTTYLLFPDTQHSVITLVRAMGAVGVDLFFVLSGFLIGGILLKNIQNNKTHFSDLALFFKRRWLRTLPNYFVVLLINIVLGFFIFENLPIKTESYFVFVQNFNTPHPNFFTEAWSLSIEEYAYLLLPILLYIFLAIFPKKEKGKLFLQITVITILGLLMLKINYYMNTNVVDYKQWSATFRKVVIYRVDAIYMGFLVVYLYQKHTSFLNKNKVKFAVMSIILFVGLHGYIYYSNATPETHLGFYVFLYLQGVGVSLACVFPYVIALKKRRIGVKMIHYISTRSYAIYLVNYSLILFSIQSIFIQNKVTILTKMGYLLCYVFFTVILSELLYKLVEQPVLRFRNKKYPTMK